MLYDISPPITPTLGVWPGDTSASREILCDIHRGDSITLSTLRATVHLGAHADGPNHYGKDAPAIDQRALDYYLGPCLVAHVGVARGARVDRSAVEAALDRLRVEPVERRAAEERGQPKMLKLPPRLLIATGTFPDPFRWNNDFAALDPALVDGLHGLGVVTVGIDTPSVDLIDSKDLPAHAAFLRNDMAILEGLALNDVPEGIYELIALPLRLVGFDASPVRAILRSMPESIAR
ncbi:MAG: cyclase family protein [Phycisphaerae bacterium]|nr:cyclase family protein [Phycisphaerae bacterium]